MAEQLPYLVEAYSALAPVYDQAGLGDYALSAVAHYISFAQSLDWAGRRVLDLGCGTGQTTWWLSEQGYRAVGVDNNPHMLAQARARDDEAGMTPPDFDQQDIRQLVSPIGEVDLVLAVGGLINALQSLRELETAFTQVNHVLSAGKLFVFDARTIRGMALDLGSDNMMRYDDGHSLAVFVHNQFSFETLSSTRHFIIFKRDGMTWTREDEIHHERGYPTQGIVAMLERTGFHVEAVLTDAMQLFDIHQETTPHRAIFVAQKNG